MVLLDERAQLRRDAIGHVARYARVNADDLEMRDLAQRLQEKFDPPVRQHERVAARQDHIADLGVLAEVAKGRVELVEWNLFRVAYLAPPRAEPAVSRTHR